MEFDPNSLPAVLRLSWDDVLLPEVLPYLPFQDLFKLRATCRACHNLVENYFARLKKIDLSDKGNVFTREAFQILTQNGSSLRSLDLTGAKFVTDDLLKPVFMENNNLLTLDLSDCHQITPACLQSLAVSCKSLKR